MAVEADARVKDPERHGHRLGGGYGCGRTRLDRRLVEAARTHRLALLDPLHTREKQIGESWPSSHPAFGPSPTAQGRQLVVQRPRNDHAVALGLFP